jgi:ribosomal subunit interface protein
MELTDAIKDVVRDKMAKLFKHEPQIVRLRVELIHDTHKVHPKVFTARGQIAVNGPNVVVGVMSDDLYGAVDELVNKLDRQLRRRSRELKSRRKTASSA